MSYLARLSARVAGPRANTPPVLPKGLPKPPAATVARAEETGDEEETVAPMRPPAARGLARQAGEDVEEGEEVSRQDVEEEPEAEGAAAQRNLRAPGAQRQADETAEEDVAPLRRQETEEEDAVAPLRRQEEEEEAVAPLRRQAGEEEEAEIAPLRRQESEEDPEARPMRVIARQEEVPLEDTGQTAPPRAEADLEPAAEPPSEEMAGEREPSDLQALRRDISPGPAPALPRPTASEPLESRSANGPISETMAFPDSPMAPFDNGMAVPPAASQSVRAEDPRPNVTIDQLDVLIHEPAMPAERSNTGRDRDRAMRARYLRRL